MTFWQYFLAGAGIAAGVATVALVTIIILGLFDKVRELLVVARALQKRGKG